MSSDTQIQLDFDPFAEPDEDGQRALSEGFGDYAAWRRARGLELIDAQLHAERLAHWRDRPRFLLVTLATAAQLPLLARTLDNLQKQLYQDWCLAILSDQPSPSTLFGGDPTLQWLQLADIGDHEAVAHVLNTLAIEGGFDWMATLPAGFELEPNALLLIGDHIDRHPGGVAFYSDDDHVDEEGVHGQPRFKPRFDIDFLRSFDYVGASLWLKTDAVEALGGLAPLGNAMGFEFLLRAWEMVGDAGIGHIAFPLTHLAAEAAPDHGDSRLHDAAVIAHLERTGFPAVVEKGFAEGTRRIRWMWPEQVRVTITIPIRDRLEFLAPCVESILERTVYPNFEILLVDNQSSDPDTVTWLQDIVATEPDRVRLIERHGEFDVAASHNLAADESRSGFLCLLEDDIEVIQGEWLGRLLELAQRPDVGAVGARLVAPETGELRHTGFVLGMEPGGIAGSPLAGLCGLREAGPLMRLQVVRAASGVSAACMLVRRSDYLAAGGMDETLSGAWADIDLCLRLREVGRRVLWTPFATLVHYGVTRDPRGLSPSAQASKVERILAARDEMLTRWRTSLALDPFYNRNLSLIHRDMRLEAPLRAAWDTTFRERPRLLGIPLTGGSGIYRVKEPFDALADAGRLHVMYPVAVPKAVRLPTVIEVARLEPDTLLIHSRLDEVCLDTLEQNRRFNPGIFQLFGLDDLVTQIPEKSSAWLHFRRHFRDARPRLRAALKLCDRLVVSTDPLADLCRDMIDDIVVVPNRLSRVWQGHASRRNRTDKPRVGWVGAQQHQGDLELIETVIETLADEVDFVFMGMATDRIRPHLAEFHQPVPWEEYPAKVASLDLDIALAPLELVPFNEAKSNLRLLEYGIFGWPVVCTDIYPYRHDNAPVTRVPNEPDAWIEAIRALARDPERRAREGDALQAWVRRGYLLDEHLEEWQRALLR